MGSWVGWFCSIKGNEFFCEVDEDYIQDDFNLSGLPSQVPYYEYALELILDADSGHDEILTEAQQAAVEAAAEALYGLIHARFILTTRGLAAMAEKFRSTDFGRCPRVLCNGQPCLPVGLSDQPRQSTVKLFCPRCEEAYYPRSKYHGHIDGAYFGTTFPHLFFLTYPQLKPSRPVEKYVPRVFGFKVSPLAWEKQQPEKNNGGGGGGGSKNNVVVGGGGGRGRGGVASSSAAVCEDDDGLETADASVMAEEEEEEEEEEEQVEAAVTVAVTEKQQQQQHGNGTDKKSMAKSSDDGHLKAQSKKSKT